MKAIMTPVVLLVVILGLCVAAKAAEDERQRPKSPEAQQRIERERAMQRIADLKVKGGELVKEGKWAPAEAIRQEVKELESRFGLGERPRPTPPAGPVPEAMERRLMHARIAIQNLQEAGMREHAERVEQDVERMMREFREQAERREMAERREHEARQRAERERAELRERREGPRPGAEPRLEPLVDQLNQMRREIQELREMVKRLAERERK
jgi:hypothetical protein